MDAWVIAFVLGVSLVMMVLFIKTKGVLFGVIGGIVSLYGAAQLFSDKALVYAHECCNGGADIPLSLSGSDLIIVGGVLFTFVIVQFAMVIMVQTSKNPEM